MKRSPIRRRNPERRKKSYARNFGERADAVRAMPCLHHGSACAGPIVAAHTIARGMGGAKGSRRNLVPLCQASHVEAGENRTSARCDFEERTGLDLQAEAARIAAYLDEQGLP